MYDGLLHLRDVVRQRQLDCTYCYEITHHNPTDLSASVLFLEVGDGPEEWRDRELAGAAAEAALRLCFEPPRDPRCRCLGISHGDHYAGNFARLALEEGYAFGHILSGRSLPELRLQDFQNAMERTEGSIDRIVFKRLKGLPLPERGRLEEYCQSRGILLEKYRRPPA
jgi:D-tyrosyl-tRNA(Tyr) deacylase